MRQTGLSPDGLAHCDQVNISTGATLLAYNRPMSTTTFLDRFLDPVTDAFTPEMAEVIVSLQADEGTQARVQVLREKANEGTLTKEEDAEYRDFVEAVDVISILQSKARQFLARQSS